ncbi:oxygen-independent coproporphyrinogen III oxidase [Vulgatibacter incomptus]|uniref:Coproporphyrinogen-III oxidase n=1 Tax=Vulgatibacter incomptus TaxID=1391653 RepID=A0A0K1PIQ2_9BACT|nr:oxygen-independent coproporphyrinogen III oxidase [Vulgatibacter incomptus]AKU92989.1 Coproporphyrinogen III oxidase, oxygen-independent [Vulgatibacter incomptus]
MLPENRMAELVARHDKPGPRYTSYPTVPAWTDAFGPDDFAAKLEEAGAAGDELPLSLYVHLPFCRELCTYCGCNVVISSNRDKHEEYVEVVRAELDLAADRLGRRNRLLQLHYGGGTPTSLDEALLVRLWDKITERFEVRRDAEVAIEVDPVVTSREQLALLRGMGFNRLSLGVQDFTPEVQRAVNRLQTVEETEKLVEYARKLGYRGINFDLIYGLPHQRMETFARSIEEVIRLAPDRVAIFSYAHVPDLRPHQRKIDEGTLPAGPEKLALFQHARERLLAEGYVAIGMDHFARKDDELALAQAERRLSRSFQGYTVRPAPDIVAVGATAISDLRGSYAQNVRPLGAYYEAIRAGRFATEKGAWLERDDLLRRDAITQLMCNFHLDLGALGEKHGVDAARELSSSLEALRPLEEDGLVRRLPGAVEVTPDGQPFVRAAAMAFDAWLGRLPPTRKGKLPVFSRTI